MSDRLDSRVSAQTSWTELLNEITPILSLVRRISPENRSYQMSQMLEEPSYILMERLISDLTIVFSIPKVGGQTIAATLSRHPAIYPEPVHIHFLSPKGLDLMNRRIEEERNNPHVHNWITLLARSHWLRMLLAANRMLRAGGMSSLVRKPFLIAGVREPMAQYLSLVFQAWWMYADSPQNITVEDILKQMADDPLRHHCNNWFTDELHNMFGLDVFSRPFPAKQGWDIYENDAARVLIIRQENLVRLPEAMGNFFDFDPASVEVENRNEAVNKQYASHYRAVKESLRLSDRELEEIYSLPYVRHFYTPAEVETFKLRWRRGMAIAPFHLLTAGDEQENPIIPIRSAARSKIPETGVEQENPIIPITSAARSKFPETGDEQENPIIPISSAARSKFAGETSHESNSASLPAAQHSWTCRPCAKCALQLHSIPTLQQASEERLALIQQLDAELNTKVPLAAKWRTLIRRIFGYDRSAA